MLQYTYVQNLSDNVKIMLVPANSPYLFPLPQEDLAMPAAPMRQLRSQAPSTY